MTLAFQLMLFFGAWTLRVVLYPVLDGALPADLAGLGAVALRVLIWTVPLALYLVYGLRVDALRYLKLSTRALRGLLWGAALAGLLLLSSFALLPGLRPALPGWAALLDVVVVGSLSEELVFRGYVLRRLRELGGFWPANLLAALLSTLIYWPRWLLLLGAGPDGALALSAPTFAVGVLAGYLVRRSDSLWPAVLLQAAVRLLDIGL